MMQSKDLLPWARKEGSGELKGADDNPIAALQREMNRAFESFWSRGERPFGGLAAVFGEDAPRSMPPATCRRSGRRTQTRSGGDGWRRDATRSSATGHG